MSIVLVQSIEELLITAVTRLNAELKAETDPKRLVTLLTLAFRAAKAPRALTTPPASKRPRSPEPVDSTNADAAPAAPDQRPSALSTPARATQHSAPPSPLPSIEDFTRDAVIKLAAQAATRPRVPGPYVYATQYLIDEKCISHPRNADGTPIPLDDPGNVARPAPRERVVFALRSANRAFRRHHSEQTRAENEAREAEEKRRRTKR